MPQDIPPGSLDVDFNEVTEMFAKLRGSITSKTKQDEFVKMVSKVAQELFGKYFEFPRSRYYKQPELMQLVYHILSCINNIIPEHLLARSRI